MQFDEQSRLLTFFPLPDGIIILAVAVNENSMVIKIACTFPCAPCPLCGQASERVHGDYVRTVADLPCAGRRVILEYTVRKFVCGTASCPRKIFTEQHESLVQSYARMTNRLVALVQAVGLASGGEVGSRLAERMSIHLSPSTVLRRIMAVAQPDTSAVRILGVDDFAWKKRLRYGTILVDLERHKIIDVLLDRSDTTFTQWLETHPTVEVICRDRATDYARAANQAAPQALQVADRFHLIRTLADALMPLLSRCQKECQPPLRETIPSLPPNAPPTSHLPLPTPQTWQQQPPEVVERKHQIRQVERDRRYQQMATLREQGLTQTQIAKQMGVGVRTVRSWLKAGTAPSWKRCFRRRSIFDQYAPYVLQRWQEGVHDGKQIYEEIRAQGFIGSHGIVKRFLQTLRGKRGKLRPNQPPPPAIKGPAPNTPTWLFIRHERELTAEERIELFLLCHHNPTARLAYLLVQAFLTMLRLRRGYEFEGWLQAVEASRIPELQRFAHSLLRDRKAVEAGLTYAYSSGPVEAQVHKLKLVKRSMFGRAKLPLLRQRLLHAI